MTDQRFDRGGKALRVVFDVGCAAYGGDESIPYLIEEFTPDVLVGLDPSRKVRDGRAYEHGGTRVFTYRKAAWLYDGEVAFTEAGTSGKVGEGPLVPCVDLLRLIREHASWEVFLKMDCEGSEYALLPHLRDHDADLLLKLAWVEPHCLTCGRGGGHREGCDDMESYERYERLEATMRCEMHRWNR